jgi:hypothetical protein
VFRVTQRADRGHWPFVTIRAAAAAVVVVVRVAIMVALLAACVGWPSAKRVHRLQLII